MNMALQQIYRGAGSGSVPPPLAATPAALLCVAMPTAARRRRSEDAALHPDFWPALRTVHG
jgi:hypothetical protein